MKNVHFHRKHQVSDDTVLLLSTAEALVAKSSEEDTDKLYAEIAFRYQKDFFKDMGGRAGGKSFNNNIVWAPSISKPKGF